MSTSPLSIDVYVAPMRPYTYPDQLGEGEVATWAPSSSTLWLGLARLLQHFPEARGYAAPEVAGRAAWEAEFNKTSKYWTSRFPGELPEMYSDSVRNLSGWGRQIRFAGARGQQNGRAARRRPSRPVNAIRLSGRDRHRVGVAEVRWAIS